MIGTILVQLSVFSAVASKIVSNSTSNQLATTSSCGGIFVCIVHHDTMRLIDKQETGLSPTPTAKSYSLLQYEVFRDNLVPVFIFFTQITYIEGYVLLLQKQKNTCRQLTLCQRPTCPEYLCIALIFNFLSLYGLVHTSYYQLIMFKNFKKPTICFFCFILQHDENIFYPFRWSSSSQRVAFNLIIIIDIITNIEILCSCSQ